jgi:hypothetical protein
MKTLLIIFLLIFSVPAFAPGSGEAVIFRDEAIYFDRMLYSFQAVESNFDTKVINSLGYGGILQIGQEMINEANRICKLTGNPAEFTLIDRLDSTKSVQIWYIVQNYWNPSYDLMRACKVWNPLASKEYYQKIKQLI